MKKKAKKTLQKVISLLLAFSLIVGTMYLTPMDASAATTKLNKDSLVLVKGHGYTLKLSGTSRKVTWKSSNNSVVTYKKLSNTQVKLTAKGTGTAYMYAKVGSKTYKCGVKVINAKLNATKKTIYKGSSYTLKVSGSTARKWVSKNTSIATVSSSGKVTGKKAGTVRILAYVNNSILYADITVKNKPAVDPEEMEYTGQHKTFDGLHIGNGAGYERYCLSGSPSNGGSVRALTIPVYNGKLVDIRDEDMFRKALRADKVVGSFYNKYIREDMDDVERLQAVFKYLNSKPTRLVGWYGFDSKKGEKYVVDAVTNKCQNGCSKCQKFVNSINMLGLQFTSNTEYANTAYAALYSNAATNKGWAEAFEYLCVAAGLKAFMLDYDMIFYPVRVNMFGYWVDIAPYSYSLGASLDKKGYFYFGENGCGVIKEKGRNDIFVNAALGSYINNTRVRCQYIELKNWNRYSSSLPKLYKHGSFGDERDYTLQCKLFSSNEEFEEELNWWNEINEEYGVNHILYSDPSKNFLMYY